jgi:hypothetical protein
VNLTTYEIGNIAPPEKIVVHKKAVLRDLFEDKAGIWISREQIAKHLESHGLEMNQVTARISDLRREYRPEGLGIFSNEIDTDAGAWEYKLDLMTPEYEEMYFKRREDEGFTKEDLLNLKAAMMFVLDRYSHQNESFWITAYKLGIKKS